MKLLLDNMLSPRLVPLIERQFEGSAHVHVLGLRTSPDKAVWDAAKAGNFTVVTKDRDDFLHLSSRYGPPPKVIVLEIGNCTTAEIRDILIRHETSITNFGSSSDGVLVLRLRLVL